MLAVTNYDCYLIFDDFVKQQTMKMNMMIILWCHDKIEILFMERSGRERKGFLWLENEDLGWYSYDEILCVINPADPQTRHTFLLSREDLDKIYELMLQH